VGNGQQSRSPGAGVSKPSGSNINTNTSAQQGMTTGNPDLEKIFPGIQGVGQPGFDESNEWNQQLMRIHAEQNPAIG
jgi:hypothetical protein